MQGEKEVGGGQGVGCQVSGKKGSEFRVQVKKDGRLRRVGCGTFFRPFMPSITQQTRRRKKVPDPFMPAWGGLLYLLFGFVLLLSMGCDHQVTGADPTAVPAADITVLDPKASAAPASESLGGAQAAAKAKSHPSSTRSQPASAEIPAESESRPPKQTVDSTFDDLKFDMEKTDRFDRSMLTPRIEQLFGMKIRIRGYIFPTLRKRGLKQFVLVRDNLECCFGPGAALYDCILVRMQAGKTAEYTIRPVAVDGILRFEEFLGPEGKHLAIFCLEGEGVK